MRSLSICTIVVAAAVILLAQPAAALPILSIPFCSVGPAYYLNAAELAELNILEVNVSHAVAADSEAFAVSFAPPAAFMPGSSAHGLAIAQTSSRSLSCSQAYFFQDYTVP